MCESVSVYVCLFVYVCELTEPTWFNLELVFLGGQGHDLSNSCCWLAPRLHQSQSRIDCLCRDIIKEWAPVMMWWFSYDTTSSSPCQHPGYSSCVSNVMCVVTVGTCSIHQTNLKCLWSLWIHGQEYLLLSLVYSILYCYYSVVQPHCCLNADVIASLGNRINTARVTWLNLKAIFGLVVDCLGRIKEAYLWVQARTVCTQLLTWRWLNQWLAANGASS